MNLIEEYLRLTDYIDARLNSLKKEQYSLEVDEDWPWEYCDYTTGEPEWYAITGIAKEDGWRFECEDDLLPFKNLPLKVQCEILEFVKNCD